MDRLFVLAFENDAQRTSHKRYYIPNVKIKDYHVMTDGKKFFDQPVKNDKVTYENIRNVSTGQGDDYATGCLLDYVYFKNYYKMIAVNLSKQEALDTDPKAIQQINFTDNLERAGNTRFYFILEEAKETVFKFLQGTVKVLSMQLHWMQVSWRSLIFINIKTTQYNSLYVKLLKLNKLKSAIKNETELVLRLSSNISAIMKLTFLISYY